ncbi:phenylacetate--CoA ligase family protein [Streptomyces sp. NPDC059479]|uniref:phenylacetate--CoA ligase family protein n=1 Tax=Streptomyces sp. NPDC059479 TaxID=3346848 RepID=UPI0036BEA95B
MSTGDMAPLASRPEHTLRAAAHRAARTSPYYRDLPTGHGGSDCDSGGGSDSEGDGDDHARAGAWADIPFTSAADLLRGGSRMAARTGVTAYASSGTGGSAKPAFFTARDRAATVRRTAAGLVACGVDPDDTLVVAHGFGIWLIGPDFTSAGEELGLRVVPVGKGPGIAHTLALLRELGADVIATSPGYAQRLAALVGPGDTATALGTRMLLLSGETVSGRLRASMREAWGLDAVHSFYGSAELGHLGCDPAADGSIALTSDLAYEVLTANGPAELREGATGELVVTTLFQEGMPLVRYRTGDLVRLTRVGPQGPVVALEAQVLGRIAESAVLESGEKLWAWQVEEALVGTEGITDFRAYVDEVPMDRQWFDTGDRLSVRVATRGDRPLTCEAVRRLVAALREMSLDMSAAVGSVEIELAWCVYDDLVAEDGPGKPRRLVDRRDGFPAQAPAPAEAGGAR